MAQGEDQLVLKNAPWDSDFCQYGMMEHTKMFPEACHGVINTLI